MFTISNLGILNKIFQIIKALLLEITKHPAFIHKYNYDFIWKKILARNNNVSDKKTFLGAFADWDNSARKNIKSTIVNGANPTKFEKYFSQQLKKTKSIKSEFVFFNAWNEWAESAYLEPDEKYDNHYLSIINKAVNSTDISEED